MGSPFDQTIARRTFLQAGAIGACGLASAPLGRIFAAEETNPVVGKIASDEQGDVYRVLVKLRTPKSGKDKRMPRPLDSITCSVFLSRGTEAFRGATFNPFYEPTVDQQHWRACVADWGFAHVGANFFGVKKDELGETVAECMKSLAEVSGHAELADTPLCFHGMSIGGGLSLRLVEAMPERAIAAAPVCLEVGPRDEPSCQVPMVTIFGEKDGRQMEKLSAKLPEMRTLNAQWAIAPQWNKRHDWHRANDMIMPYYNRVIDQRLTGSDGLKDLKTKSGWLGDPKTWRRPFPTVAPYAEYSGDPAEACWLPDAYTASLWRSFVAFDNRLKITSPAGMGDDKPFSTIAAAEPVEVTLNTHKDLNVAKLEVHDGDRRLATASGDPPVAKLDKLDHGVHALIAIATLPDGSRVVSPPNAIVVA